MLGPERLVLITDAMQATGLGEGIYLLGDREVLVGPDGPRVGRTILAGSTLTMDRAVANLQHWTTATEDEARACASVNPARILGLEAQDP
jgi:N-acetylglucosamine-6-phosphate deacetylase